MLYNDAIIHTAADRRCVVQFSVFIHAPWVQTQVSQPAVPPPRNMQQLVLKKQNLPAPGMAWVLAELIRDLTASASRCMIARFQRVRGLVQLVHVRFWSQLPYLGQACWWAPRYHGKAGAQ